ncbi:putative nuclease HARBI1 [Ischnura elegans]|uniref:putative nuclease HARBI1 n=1 Tax=Ischnura elegans TaxID=197161 RepID=UPI001ED86C66|nr:putative nuclease HARBI1 [Ischnura elegans]
MDALILQLMAGYRRYIDIRNRRLHLLARMIDIDEALVMRMRRRAARRAWRFVRAQGFWERDVPAWPEDVFQKTFRLCRETFSIICRDLGETLARQDTQMREAIPVRKKVAIALYFLKSGSDYGVVGMTFGVGRSTVSAIVEEFCAAVRRQYHPRIRFPATEEDMRATANQFEYRWDFPGVIGAVDGCHIPIKTPSHEGGDYYNYKGWHSIILLAVVDSAYRFTYVNVGYPGRVNDAGVLRASALWRKLTSGEIPNHYHLVGDGAFPLGQHMLKPFQQPRRPCEELFNYRLSRARMVVENAFGRLKGRWRVLLKAADVEVGKLVSIVNTCCILHNICEANNEPVWPEWIEEANDQFPQPGFENHGDVYLDGVEKRLLLAEQLQ